jgi:hypothetical protein
MAREEFRADNITMRAGSRNGHGGGNTFKKEEHS